MVKRASRFFDGKSALIALLEWTAIQKITFKGDVQKMAEQFPEHLKAQASWVKTFNQDARQTHSCLLYTSPSARELSTSRMPSSA